VNSVQIKRLLFSLAAALPIGALVAAFGPGAFVPGWLTASLLLWVAFYCLYTVWRWANVPGVSPWHLALIIGLAFVLRLGIGITLNQVLPVYGFDEPEQNAGYSFYDAYMRDTQAWELAKSDKPLSASFGEEFATDQYGGLLSISAAAYRYLSPDAHRSALILILGAFTTALGIAFFWKAVSTRWNPSLAFLASWIVALYPDGLFFGSSQMREPFLVGLICIAFWGVLAYPKPGAGRSRRGPILAIVLSLIVMALISSRVAFAAAAALAVWFWIEHLAPRSRTLRNVGLGALVVAGVALLVFSWAWLRSSSHWDTVLTVRNSGRVEQALSSIGEQFTLPFVVGYGLAQPVLPAAIADDTLPVWKIIIVFRSAGWYLLAPLMLYALFAIWKVKPASERGTLIWLAGFMFLWIIIASIRAGGDMVDNPRYRSIFLPWLALLAAWSVQWAVQHRDFWLARWLIVEAIFLGFFTNWYLSRYLKLWDRLPFWTMVVWIVGLSGLVLASGWLWDLWKTIQMKSAFRRKP
jgi:hypothetical protein